MSCSTDKLSLCDLRASLQVTLSRTARAAGFFSCFCSSLYRRVSFHVAPSRTYYDAATLHKERQNAPLRLPPTKSFWKCTPSCQCPVIKTLQLCSVLFAAYFVSTTIPFVKDTSNMRQRSYHRTLPSTDNIIKKNFFYTECYLWMHCVFELVCKLLLWAAFVSIE